MKRIVFIAVALFFISALFAQEKDSTTKFAFPRHEVKASLGDVMYLNENWAYCRGNLSISYSYRCLKWLWFGVQTVGYIPVPNYYDIREYDVNNNYIDSRYITKDYGFGFLPNIRFSYLNRKKTTLYSTIAVGYSILKTHTAGIPNKPEWILSGNITLFGFSCYFGKNQKIFMGGEMTVGNIGFISIHGGYRF